MLQDALHILRIRRSIQRLNRRPDVIADNRAGCGAHQGVSARMPRQSLPENGAQIMAGSQVTPDSMSTTFISGNFAKVPSETKLASCTAKACVCAT